jgi:hypothetical protein
VKPLPKPPGKLPPRGGPMSPPPARTGLPPMPSPRPTVPQAPQTPPPLAAVPPPGQRPGLPPRPGAAAPSQPAVAVPPLPGSPSGVARTAKVAAAGATGTVSAVIEAVRLVDDVLAEENLVLRRHDARAAAALQERKQAATRLYHERMRIFARDAEAARAMRPEEKAELVALAQGLDQRVRENAILLKATMDSIDRLFAAINHAAQQKVQREVSYSRAGMVAPSSQPGAASVAFNRTV